MQFTLLKSCNHYLKAILTLKEKLEKHYDKFFDFFEYTP